MELNLDLSLNYVPKTVSELLREVSRTRNASEKLAKLDDYLNRLEEEMRKIDAFKRELPLCMLLLYDAIGRLKEAAAQCKEEQRRPVTAEFLPLRRDSGGDGVAKLASVCSDKKNWMSSAQLWSTNVDYDNQKQNPDARLKLRTDDEDRSVPQNPIQLGNCGNRGGPFLPLKDGSVVAGTALKEDKQVSQVPSLSLMTPTSGIDSCSSISIAAADCRVRSTASCLLSDQIKLHTKPQPQQQQPLRKQRRCWSPELHRRFVDALQQLGGSQVATPKQIRELMQVDGLTNDEVKSHLQKYRLHIRRLPASSAAASNGAWMAQEQAGDRSKPSIAQSGSPQGPLSTCGSAKGISSTGGDSMEAEDD